MSKIKTNGGGQFKSAADFKGQEIEFPVTYNLKAVLPANREDNNERIEKVLTKNKINFSFKSKKVSSKGTYASFTYQVSLENKSQMEKLYSDLNSIEDLKFAI
jgi:putative lipoic acid-binding regulatory protein